MQEAVNFSSAVLWSRAEELVREEYIALGQLMEKLGSPSPHIHWQVDADNLPCEELKFLLNWWEATRAGRFAPMPTDVDPFALRPVLGRVTVLDVLDGGEDFRYRLYGSAIMNEPGKDLTGQLVSEIWTPLRAFFAITYRALLKRREPLYTRHVPHHSLKLSTWDRLILPLGENGEVSRILVGLISTAD
ncbi:PAS domain-containing protein [Kiloniella laminariae]|uniref:PAS domain-containing protein n=1 Tax=Kiloniella laminariae TaxID=454162 RepID=UPI00036FC66E|nr:PAS domain-containing protein [Kiloniella laminariae]